MNDKLNSQFEVPDQLRTYAEQSVTQARKAIEDFMKVAQTTVTSVEGSTQQVQAGAADINKKMLTYAEENISAAFDFAEKMARAKDMEEIMKLQSEFMTKRMSAFGEQTREIGDTAAKTASDVGQKATKG
ncbi:phasin family protein [Amorphus coralli]|uniref:phasin family protein n=1 Tax=Amorphus coralli TaxID=340680 RepID=UPI0003679B6F|nr:phasin family protein [Amorphus coralli]